MTWLGKILAVVAMVLALGWMWLTASVYVTRTNWKTQLEAYKKGYEEAKAARESEYRVFLAEKDALAKQVNTAAGRADELSREVATLKTANKDYTGQIAALSTTITNSDVTAKELQALTEAQLDEVNKTRSRSNALEERVVQLVVVAENAQKDKQAAEIAMRQAQAERDSAAAQKDDLRDQLAAAKRGGGAGGLNLNKAPPELSPDFRTSVTGYQNGLVSLNLGFDAGLVRDSVIELSRTGTDSRYLGRAVVIEAQPKTAVARFLPPPGRQLAQLRPEELPKADDLARAPGR